MIIGVTTFVIGVFFAFNNLTAPDEKLPTIEVVPVLEDLAQAPSTSTMTFGGKGDVACGFDADGTRASWTSHKASDGTTINSTLLLFDTDSSARKKLKSLKSSASRIIEEGSYFDYREVKIGDKFLIENKKGFTLVTYKQDEKSFDVLILTSPSMEHLREFDKQRESSRQRADVKHLDF